MAIKQLKFLSRARRDLKDFPDDARKEAGVQLYRLQQGLQPEDWKPMQAAGRGVEEVRISEASGAFRVLYIARFRQAVYVLHCFQKKTQSTSSADIDVAARRYRELMRMLQDGN